MKKIFLLLACLTIMSLACGRQMLTASSTEVKATPTTDETIRLAAIVEPTESPVIYVTTAPLNVRSEANADSTILGTLAEGTKIRIFVLDIHGDDCYQGEWYAIESPIAGFVCSLYVEEK